MARQVGQDKKSFKKIEVGFSILSIALGVAVGFAYGFDSAWQLHPENVRCIPYVIGEPGSQQCEALSASDENMKHSDTPWPWLSRPEVENGNNNQSE